MPSQRPVMAKLKGQIFLGEIFCLDPIIAGVPTRRKWSRRFFEVESGAGYQGRGVGVLFRGLLP